MSAEEPRIVTTPNVTKEKAMELVKKLYGFTDIILEDLYGFDDINYRVKVNDNNKKDVWPHGYVLKIINSEDSQKKIVEAQAKMAIHLGKSGINVPQPVKNCRGQYQSLEEIQQNGNQSTKHMIRMLTYQPGVLMKHASCTNDILFKVGKLTAEVDLTLKNFYHSAYDSKTSIWALESVPVIRKYTFVVDDMKRNSLVNEVLDAFDKEVVSIMDSLEKGLVHGDLNYDNIVLKESEEGTWDIAALLDLGDTKYSLYVFELAICICYMSLCSSDPLSTGGHIIAGYNTLRNLPEAELHILKVSICARLCQSLVLGAYAYMKDPGNEYKISSAAKGWPLLELMWSIPNEELVERWRNIVATYNI